MKLKNTLIAAFAVVSAAAIAQPAHVNRGQGLINGILGKAAAGQFTDAQGRLINRYGGGWGTTYLTYGTSPSAYVKCASFLTTLMKDSYGWTPPAALGGSPYADEYYSAINSSSYGFTKVGLWSNVRVGDILASDYNDNSVETGHVMVVLDAEPMTGVDEDGNQVWSVEVMDSSSALHTNDTRDDFATLNRGGVGRGEIMVWVQNDVIVTWSWSHTAPWYSSALRPIVAGYLNVAQR